LASGHSPGQLYASVRAVFDQILRRRTRAGFRDDACATRPGHAGAFGDLRGVTPLQERCSTCLRFAAATLMPLPRPRQEVHSVHQTLAANPEAGIERIYTADEL